MACDAFSSFSRDGGFLQHGATTKKKRTEYFIDVRCICQQQDTQ